MAWRNAKRDATVPARDPMQELVDRIAEIIETTGRVPWRKEWDASKCVGPQSPVNIVTKQPYHGVNVISLGLSPRAFETGDPRWATFLQAKSMGWNVKKGERSSIIFFAKPLTVRDREAEGDEATKEIHLLRAYHVFHSTQIEGVPPYSPPTVEEAPWTRPEAVSLILQNSGVTIRSGGDRAFYSPDFDFVQLPPDVAFRAPEYWSAVAVHELGHATGHKSRMNRDLTGKFGSQNYSSEEAKVDMAAAFICNTLGLPTDFENHAVYVATWLKRIKEDRRELFRTAAEAQRICDYVLKWHPAYAAQIEAQPDRPAHAPDQQSSKPIPA